MDLLQSAHIGRRLSSVVGPPLLSGISWPASKLNTLIIVWHHVTWHLASKHLPLYASHSALFKAAGIACLRFVAECTRLRVLTVLGLDCFKCFKLCLLCFGFRISSSWATSSVFRAILEGDTMSLYGLISGWT